MNKPLVILASSSSGRKKIITSLKIPYEIIPSEVDENTIAPPDPKDLVMARAKVKGESVEKMIISRSGFKTRPYIIIAADSMVVLNGKAYGKAKNTLEAKDFLRLLSGKTHSFITAVWIKNTATQTVSQKIVESKVTLRKLTDEEIDTYARFDDLTKYAGAYSIFDSAQNFVTKIDGSITNVVGLPLEFIIPVLKENGLLE